MAEKTILVVSDIHYACAAERARAGYEARATDNWLGSLFLRAYRDYFWLRNPTEHNHLLDQFILNAPAADFVVANGDYSCNTGFIGVSDDAACQSARECLDRLREEFEPNLACTFGDHELGKTTLLGNKGGLRFHSWERAQRELGLKPFWKLQFGRYVFLGVTSTLIALPVFEQDASPEEWSQWEQARAKHLADIRSAVRELSPDQKVILFCHDPTALPFLWHDEQIQSKAAQIERTIIGHLHSPLFIWKSRILAGMPPIRFLGKGIYRYTRALQEAKHWRPFNISLCPSLAGIELLKDGGYLKLTLDLEATKPVQIEKIRIRR